MNETEEKRRATTLKFAGLIMMLIASSGAMAAAPGPYRLAAIDDQAMGKTVVAGDYETAIAELEIDVKKRRNRFAASNNLCVALVASGRLDAANTACERSVEIWRRQAAAHRDTPMSVRRDHAIALSNRGVLRALRGDESGALADFEKAVAQRARLHEADANLARLKAIKSGRLAAK